jgi:hypothetical protein
VQQDVLRRLVAANRDTRFGAEHGFAGIRTHADLQARVPVQEYETLRPYVDEQRRTGTPALTAEAPLFYAQTSGTTGAPKYIPIPPTVLAMHRDEQALFSFLQFRACPDAFAGKALGIMGAAVEGRLDSGHTVGSVSGHLYRSLPAVVRSRFVVPPEVLSIADYTLKYLVVLHLALAEPDITYIGTPNPSTFLRLIDLLNDRRDELLQGLETGTFHALGALDAAVQASLARRVAPNAARARQLRRAPALNFANVWPKIRLVTTWTGGSCGIALGRLRQQLPDAAMVMELGYQSSEFRGTLAIEPETPAGLPPLHHHFFEFVEQARWDDGRPEFVTLDGLEEGKRYYVIITTAGGLYRYFMNDLLEVTGFFHRTPLLRFVQKGKGVTSLTGEKLYEAQVIDALQQAASRHGHAYRFFVLVADEGEPAYRLFIEAGGDRPPAADDFAAEVDHGLGQLNIEYHGKRQSGRLRPLTVAWLARGTAEAYKAACVQAGQRESQFKPPALQYRKDLTFPFEAHVVGRERVRQS